MLLTLKNIGKISEASIELNGITVIAGENNTGKSTMGKVLFCVFNSFYKIAQQFSEERKRAIVRAIYISYKDVITEMNINVGNVAENILQKRDVYLNNKEQLYEDIYRLIVEGDIDIQAKDTFVSDLPEKIMQILKISDEDILRTVLQKRLQAEFNMQISNAYHPEDNGEINLRVKDTNIKILVKNNKDIEISDSLSLNTEVIYIDDPFVLDSLQYAGGRLRDGANTAHRNHLITKLMNRDDASSVKVALEELIISKKIDCILEKLNIVCSGEMSRKSDNSSAFVYKENASGTDLNIINISTGLKTFVILKTLLLNGSLEENGTIVLDEPEIHLHPEWQLLFAEIIVLLQKEFNMHILLNTHSPYFLNAIEVYAAKHDIVDKCKYYLAENEGKTSTVKDVTNNIESIYAKLARPLQDLENERYLYD